MTRIILMLLVMTTSSIKAQTLVENNFPHKDGRIHYQEVVQLDSTRTAADIKNLFLAWVGETFENPENVIKYNGDDKVIVRGIMRTKGHNFMISNPRFEFELEVAFKDGRYRYTLDDIRYMFTVTFDSATQHTDKPYNEWLVYSDHRKEKKRNKINKKLDKMAQKDRAKFDNLIINMKAYITVKAVEDDEW